MYFDRTVGRSVTVLVGSVVVPLITISLNRISVEGPFRGFCFPGTLR